MGQALKYRADLLPLHHELETVGAMARRTGVLKTLPLESETVILRGPSADLVSYARRGLEVELEEKS